MRISPIGAYRFIPISAVRPVRRKTKTSSKKKTSKASNTSETTTDFPDIKIKDVDPVLEDPDSSQNELDYKDPFTEIGEGFDQGFFIQQLEAAEQIHLKLGRNQPLVSKKGMLYQTFTHLTLPEAISYIELFEHKHKAPISIKFHSERIENKIKVSLTIQSSSNEPILYTIHFTPHLFEATIKRESKTVGKVSYIIRGKKLEEINGTLFGKPFTVDPVWHPHKKGILKEEYLTFGSKRIALIYQHNENFSVWHKPKKAKKMSLNNVEFKQDNTRVLCTKTLQFLAYPGQVRLLFSKGILIPTAGEIVLTTS